MQWWWCINVEFVPSVGGKQRKSQSGHPGKRQKSASRIRSQAVAVPFTGQIAGQVPDTGQIVRQAAGMVQTSSPGCGQVLAGYVIPSVQGLIMGQGVPSTNQIAFGAQILPRHQIVVKEQVKPRGHVLSKGHTSLTPTGPIQATGQIPRKFSPKVKTVGLVTDQVVASELFPGPVLRGSVAEVQKPNEGKFQA
jgi:hypothetical protein